MHGTFVRGSRQAAPHGRSSPVGATHPVEELGEQHWCKLHRRTCPCLAPGQLLALPVPWGMGLPWGKGICYPDCWETPRLGLSGHGICPLPQRDSPHRGSEHRAPASAPEHGTELWSRGHAGLAASSRGDVLSSPVQTKSSVRPPSNTASSPGNTMQHATSCQRMWSHPCLTHPGLQGRAPLMETRSLTPVALRWLPAGPRAGLDSCTGLFHFIPRWGKVGH